MKINPIFSLHYIAGTAYLLPHGQGVADHKRGICLNGTGVFLWNMLQHISDRQELLKQAAGRYQASPEEIPQLEQDLTEFLNQLLSLGILLEEENTSKDIPPDSSFCFKIGPLQIHLTGPAQAFAAELLPFQTADTACADLTVEFITAAPPAQEKGTLLIQNAQLCVYETSAQYFLQFPQMPQLTGAVLSRSGSHAAVYCRLPVTEPFCADLFHVLRFLFLYTAQKHGCYALHSASIVYQGQAWLFSGHSGMGKSTHTNLWKELFQVPVFNGDLNLLSVADGIPVVYGIPWCGTSGIAGTGTYPLGGIVLLNRAAYDECVELPMDQKILLTAQRLISPSWNACMLQQNLDFMTQLAGKIRICLLKCTKTPAAVKVIRQWIDECNKTD